jgi:predicted transposase YbfD/YdcC
MALFTECFSDLSDPRTGNAQRHDFLELLIIALLATLSGAESCVDFELFARSKEGFLREFLALDGGVPSHDTFSRLFRLIDPQAFAACLQRFALELGSAAGRAGVVAIDGKGLRAALAGARRATPLALVNAFASDCGLALGQIGVPAGTGEIAALRELLALLDLEGRTVTADAIHCQKETAQALLDKGANYVFGFKSNRFAMYDDAVLFLDDPALAVDDQVTTTDADHGRLETRRLRISYDVAWLAERTAFPGLQGLADLLVSREKAGGKVETSRRLYLLSRKLTAAQALAAVRAHWTIENQLHWVLDVAFDEDHSRARRDNAPLNLAVLRRIALNLTRAHTEKGSIRGKIKRAAWDNQFLATLLTQMR